MRKPSHHLKRLRRHSGFSQRDISHLIGAPTHGSVSKQERRSEIALRSALAYEFIYGLPVSDIFVALRDSVRASVLRQAKSLLKKLPETSVSARHAQRKESLLLILATS